MISLTKKRSEQGFTIVELLIVIVVIGILAALVVTTYAGIQGRARDSKRQTDIQSLQTQVEAFYATSNYYPSLVDINSDTWRKDKMKSLSADTMTDPSGTSNQLKGTTAAAGDKQYSYVATNSTNAACSAGDTTCDSYELSAWLESSNVAYKKAALD